MSWLQLRLDVDPATAPGLEDALLTAGAVAVTLEDNADQPLMEPGVGETPLWNQTRLTGMFAADTDMDAVLAGLPEGIASGARARIEILEDKDWEREWMQHYRPMQFGPRLWVCPSWLEPPEPNAVNLLLDPGLAFGTGTHPTTALCLAELDALDPAGKTLVDYGCGSGILAVAALKLGAARVLGIDNDPQALRASRDNAQRNSVQDTALPVALPGDNIEQGYVGSADIVVANILAGPLVALSDKLIGFLAPHGTLLLSGLLATQSDELCEHYADRLPLSVVAEQDGWVCLRGALTDG